MKLAIVTAFGLALLSTAGTAVTAAGPEGTWLSETRDTKVRIVDCGGKLCGRVVWLGEPIDGDTGKPKTDKRNPDPDKRARPLLGLQVVSGMKASGPNRWSGAVYNAWGWAMLNWVIFPVALVCLAALGVLALSTRRVAA